MRAKTMILAMASVVMAAPAAGAQRVDRARVNEYGRPTQDGPPVDVWIDRYSFSSGERLRAYFQTDPGAYVTVVRLTTRGELKVLYPHTPTVQRAFTYDLLADDGEVPYATDAAFYLNEPSGVGFVFAIASYTPFDYRAVTSHGRWSTLQLAANKYEDPFTVVNRFLTRTLARRADYSVDYIEYEVRGGGRYRTRSYSSLSYDDLYFQCLSAYGPRALNYCRTYSQFGYAPYVLGAFPRSPAPIARTPAIPSPKSHPIVRPPAIPSPKSHPIARTPAIPSPKTHPPKSFIPDPTVGDEGLKPKAPQPRYEPAPQPNPTGEEVQRVFREQPRDAGRRADDGNRESARRAEPVDTSPSEYRNERAATVNAHREPQYEAAPQRYEAAPQTRAEPAPVGALPRYEAPVVRAEPREAPAPQPAPPPPPPPPPPPAPAPAPAPAPTPVPIIPPSSPPAVDR